jgi:hypothetical protein
MIFRPHHGWWGQRWTVLSTCGRYAVRTDSSDPRETKFHALFIAGVWASAEVIAVRDTQGAAEEACEQHALSPHIAQVAVGAKH